MGREEERRGRERMLDQTIEDSFPASDPPSSLPNPKWVVSEAAKVREQRERALDQTIEDTFPASDPPSSIPDPKWAAG